LIGAAPWHVIAADDYPGRPVTVVVPFTPGGSTDIMARYEAEVLQRALGQSFVVENKPGAGGSIGISYAAKAAPDGYTLLHAPSIIILLPYVMKSISYDYSKDFAPIMLTGLTQFALVVSPALPVNSVKDLIALAKSKPSELTYASSGIDDQGARPHGTAAFVGWRGRSDQLAISPTWSRWLLRCTGGVRFGSN
jgi:tripartite-type tricarboxylate transporter receptor subunit TctC